MLCHFGTAEGFKKHLNIAAIAMERMLIGMAANSKLFVVTVVQKHGNLKQTKSLFFCFFNSIIF